MSSCGLPEVGEIGEMSAADVEAYVGSLDRERRVAEAKLAMFVQRVELSGAHHVDGHRSVKAWGKAACNWSGAEAARFAKLGRLFNRFTSAAELALRGGLGVAQVHALAGLVANPRVSEDLDDSEA